MKINKVYSSFYNGISEQPPELMVETQCKDMINCIPSIVKGLQKRPPMLYTAQEANINKKMFHAYDRGDDAESYIMTYKAVDAGSTKTTTIYIYKKDGSFVNSVSYSRQDEYNTVVDLKGLTVGDTTWIYNKNLLTKASQVAASDEYYDRQAFYWLKRSSGDSLNPYNYAVYLDGTSISATGDKSDAVATTIQSQINGSAPLLAKQQYEFLQDGTQNLQIAIGTTNQANITSVTVTAGTINSWTFNSTTRILTANVTLTRPSDSLGGFIGSLTTTLTVDYSNAVLAYKCERSGSILKISRLDGNNFEFSSWDSFGSQASEGWKGKINKLQDLPNDFYWLGTYVAITGTDTTDFTDYYVKWNGSSWEETYNPKDTKSSISNMPLKLIRGSNGLFTISEITYDLPKVGNKDNNPDPSFIGAAINHIVFYKNRLGIVANDSIVLSEVGGYENFFIKTVLSVQDTDPIDIAIATNQASKIYYAIPFNSSLYLFTKYAQYELASDGFLSPKTVNITTVSNYAMDVEVEPKTINDSLFFISKTGSKQQLREYMKTEKLSVRGIDLNVTTPALFSTPVKYLVVNSTLGFVLCCTDTPLIYVYNFIDNNNERVQSSWSKWIMSSLPSYLPTSWEYSITGNSLIINARTTTYYIYHTMDLTTTTSVFSDKLNNSLFYPISSSIKLPTYYPHLTEIGTPKDSVLLKKATINGTGDFVSRVYRIDYDKYYVKSFTDTLNDKDFHIQSKANNCEIYIEENTNKNFRIDSIVLEGLFTPTSKQLK